MTEFYLPSPHHEITYSPNPLYGYYVYLWLDLGSPFYVGMGKTYRAWAEHHPITEERKLQCTKFRVKIVEHCLTKPLAHKKERRLLKELTRQGHSLTNLRIPQC